MYAYIHKYSIHVYRPRRKAFEAGRGGSGLEPKLAGLRLTPADFRRTPPPDPPGPRTDPGRTRHRTIRTRGTGGAHQSVRECDLRNRASPGAVVPRGSSCTSLQRGQVPFDRRRSPRAHRARGGPRSPHSSRNESRGPGPRRSPRTRLFFVADVEGQGQVIDRGRTTRGEDTA